MFKSTTLVALLAATPVIAGEADVIDVKVTAEPGGTYAFDVTVRHADAGWKHDADKWDVISQDGTVYGTSVLAHPHDDEKPFTRSQNGITVPQGIKQVTIRAHDWSTPTAAKK